MLLSKKNTIIFACVRALDDLSSGLPLALLVGVQDRSPRWPPRVPLAMLLARSLITRRYKAASWLPANSRPGPVPLAVEA